MLATSEFEVAISQLFLQIRSDGPDTVNVELILSNAILDKRGPTLVGRSSHAQRASFFAPTVRLQIRPVLVAAR
jgi:hypothetical protein